MTQFLSLSQSVQAVLSTVSEQGQAHLTEVETDLAQTALLLSEAIEKLGASFMAIHVAISAQQEAVDAVLAGGATDSAKIDGMHAGQREIGRHVNAALTGLQFQDMTNQLLERSCSHVAALREVLGVLQESAASLAPGIDPEEMTALLTQTSAALEQRKDLASGARRKVVTQTHMESGDVELF